jgi:hypothetical protein
MRYIFFVGLLFSVFFTSVSFGASSSVGKRPSGIKSLTLAQVAGKLIMMQGTDQEKADLYRALRSADREKGSRNTIQFLLKVIQLQAAELPDNFDEIDWFGFAIEAIFLGGLQRLLKHKERKETDLFEQLVCEIEEMKDVVFNLLQDQALSASPRGSDGEIMYSGHKKRALLLDPLVSKSALEGIRKSLDAQLFDYVQ